jgi:hypothetical protein
VYYYFTNSGSVLAAAAGRAHQKLWVATDSIEMVWLQLSDSFWSPDSDGEKVNITIILRGEIVHVIVIVPVVTYTATW